MQGQESDTTVSGTKSGIISVDPEMFEGHEYDVNKSGILAISVQSSLDDDDTEKREPPEPPSLPEVNKDDGGTTGFIRVNTEGLDKAEREDNTRK